MYPAARLHVVTPLCYVYGTAGIKNTYIGADHMKLITNFEHRDTITKMIGTTIILHHRP
jgi:hypothetical protein